MSRNLRVAIDLDGVFRDLATKTDLFLHSSGLIPANYPVVTPTKWDIWEDYGITKEQFYEFLYDSEWSCAIFSSADMFTVARYSLDTFKRFVTQGVEFGILTTQTQRTMKYTWDWINRFTLTEIFLSVDCLVAGTERTKADFGYDVLLDDRPSNVSDFQAQFGEGIPPRAWVYDQSWNRNCALPRVFGFGEFFAYLQGILDSRK